MAVILRDYTDRDFEFVRAVFTNYLADERRRVPVLPVGDDFPDTYLPKLIGKVRSEGGVFLVAEADGVDCGFIAALPKDPQPWDQSSRKVVMVMEAHVVGAYRRRGIGRSLFSALEARFASQGFDWVTLGTFAGNKEAHMFYGRLGYGTTYQFMGKRVSRSD